MQRATWLSFLFILQIQAFSQTIDWAYGFGDWGDDTVDEITTDNHGSVYISGVAPPGTITDELTFDEGGVYVGKFDNLGNPVWVRNFGAFDSRGTDLVVDSDGNVYVTGYYSYAFEFDHVTLPDGRPNTMYLMKLDPDGKLVWLKDFVEYTTYSRTVGNALTLDKDGNIYLAGNLESKLTLGDTTFNVRGSSGPDMLLIKFSPEGDVQFVKNPGSTSYDYLYDIAVNSTGIYAVGTAGSNQTEFDNFIHQTDKGEQGVLFHYSLDGEFKWAKSFETYYSEAYSVKVNDKNEIFVSGLWVEGNTDAEKHFFISKLDSNGGILFTRLIQRGENLCCYGLSLGKRSEIAINGADVFLTSGIRWAMEIGPFSFEETGSTEIAVYKFNEIGYPQWLYHTTNPGNDRGLRITAFEKNIYFSGSFASETLTIGNTSLTNNSGNNDTDVFMARMTDIPTQLCPENNFTLTYPSSFCEGDSLQVSIVDPYAVYTTWYKNGQALPLNNKKQVYLKEPGTYEVGINKNTVCPGPTLSLKVDHEGNTDQNTDVILYPVPTFSIEEDGGLFCQRDTMELSVEFNENYFYDWNVPSAFVHSDAHLNAIKIGMTIPTNSDTVFLEVTNKDTGCKANDTITFQVESSAIAQIHPLRYGLCEGNQIFVQAKSEINYQYVWEVPEFFPAINEAASAITFQITDEMDGAKLVVNVNEFGSNCVSKDSIYLEVHPPFEIDVKVDGDSLKLISDDVINAYWYLDNKLLPFTPNAASLFIEEPGDYSVVAFNENNCISSIDIPKSIILSSDNNLMDVLFYPNPVKNFIKVQSTTIPKSISVFDLTGRLLSSKNDRFQIDLSFLNPGIYMLQVDFGTHTKRIKIIKE